MAAMITEADVEKALLKGIASPTKSRSGSGTSVTFSSCDYTTESRRLSNSAVTPRDISKVGLGQPRSRRPSLTESSQRVDDSSLDADLYNPEPQAAPGSSAPTIGHSGDNSIPLSIFPIAVDKFCICFCGLPGRGKTHIARRLAKYLSFFHAMPVEMFNVDDYRRRKQLEKGLKVENISFDINDPEFVHLNDEARNAAVSSMTTFLNSNTSAVAIYDSTNYCHARRMYLADKIRPTGAKMLWIEVMNNDEDELSAVYRVTATSSPDYHAVDDKEIAEEYYRRRVAKYESIFEPIDANLHHPVESRWSYFKCDHSQQHFVVHRVKGYMPMKIVHFIMSLRLTPHRFYLSRHGQSEYNAVGRIGGDSGLTQHGLNYAKKLAEFVDEKVKKDEHGRQTPARLWTSTMRRTKETAQFIQQDKILIKREPGDKEYYEWVQMRPKHWFHLDELFAGACDGMTYEEIEEYFPEEFARREADKLAYRYPRGESYLDVIARLEPIIIEMERHREPLLIVGHQGILRIIYAFYMGLTRAGAPYVSIPLNTVIELKPSAVNCYEERFTLYVPTKALAHDGQDEPVSGTNSCASSVKDSGSCTPFATSRKSSYSSHRNPSVCLEDDDDDDGNGDDDNDETNEDDGENVKSAVQVAPRDGRGGVMRFTDEALRTQFTDVLALSSPGEDSANPSGVCSVEGRTPIDSPRDYGEDEGFDSNSTGATGSSRAALAGAISKDEGDREEVHCVDMLERKVETRDEERSEVRDGFLFDKLWSIDNTIITRGDGSYNKKLNMAKGRTHKHTSRGGLMTEKSKHTKHFFPASPITATKLLRCNSAPGQKKKRLSRHDFSLDVDPQSH